MPTAKSLRALARDGRCGRSAAPIRQVHLGLGAFFRAHQAWYTERSSNAATWGIAAFTGRRPDLAQALTQQGGLYTLITRSNDADTFDVISSVSRAHAASDAAAWRAYLATPQVTVVSLTVTEAAYRSNPSGGLNLDDRDVAADFAAWRAGAHDDVTSVPGRLAAGFAARRAADAGPITLMSCDNLSNNSTIALQVASDFAATTDDGLASWIATHVRAANTLVDRITPATTDEDVTAVREQTGYADRIPVVAEPYAEWVLSDTFAAVRPAWESAGALVVADVLPYEQRKLWLLNGAHSLLAYAAPSRGHATVAEAIADPIVLDWVREWWSEAVRHLSMPDADSAAYCNQLLERFGNARIAHQLAQIAADGSQKLPARVLPVLRLERSQGRLPLGALRIVAGWVAHLRGHGVPVTDAAMTDTIRTIQSAGGSAATRLALGAVDPRLCDDSEVVEAVEAISASLTGQSRG
jgi:fructuronate reductase